MEIPDLGQMRRLAEEAKASVTVEPNGLMRIILDNAQMEVGSHPLIPGGRVLLVKITPNIMFVVNFDLSASQIVGRALSTSSGPEDADLERPDGAVGNDQDEPA